MLLPFHGSWPANCGRKMYTVLLSVDAIVPLRNSNVDDQKTRDIADCQGNLYSILYRKYLDRNNLNGDGRTHRLISSRHQWHEYQNFC